MKWFTFRGILRVEEDGYKNWYQLMLRQKYEFDIEEDINLILGLDREVKLLKPDEVRYFAIKGTIVYTKGGYWDDDDMWIEDLVLKPRNRYIKRYPSRPEPKE